MAGGSDTVMLYTLQTEQVIARLKQEGRVFCQRAYIQRKYAESAPVFLAAYDWFAREATAYAPKPPGAQLPYWAFRSLESIEKSAGSSLLRLAVPPSASVFFSADDWYKILKLQLLGENEQEEQEFRRQLHDYNVRQESDVLLTNFYPLLKRQVQQSWQRLFRYHEQIKAGNEAAVPYVQAALWEIKAAWIEEVIPFA